MRAFDAGGWAIAGVPLGPVPSRVALCQSPGLTSARRGVDTLAARIGTQYVDCLPFPARRDGGRLVDGSRFSIVMQSAKSARGSAWRRDSRAHERPGARLTGGVFPGRGVVLSADG